MSTKTTIKRIALVAVSALGLGVLTATTPASAAVATGVSLNTSSITVVTDTDTAKALVAVTVTSDTASTGLSGTEVVAASVIGVPTTVTTTKTLASNKTDISFREVGLAAQASGSDINWGSFTDDTTNATNGSLTDGSITAGNTGYYNLDHLGTDLSTAKYRTYFISIKASSSSLDQGVYTVAFDLKTAAAGAVVSRQTLKIDFVSLAESSGAVVAAAAAGSWFVGDTPTAGATGAQTSTKYITASITNRDGGRIFSTSGATNGSAPALSATIKDSSTTAIIQSMNIADDSTNEVGFSNTTADRTTYAVDGSYTVYNAAQFTAAKGPGTLTVRYGLASATASVVINAGPTASTVGTADAVGTGIVAATDAAAIPLTTKSITSRVLVKIGAAAQAGYNMYYTLAYGASCVTGDMTPAKASTPTKVQTDALGYASLVITSAAPAAGCTATVTWTGAATNPNAQVYTWAKAAAASALPNPAGNFQALQKSTNKVTWTIVDQFSAPVVGAAVVFSVTGANAPTTTPASVTTDANGQVSYSWTDAKADATTTSDTVSIKTVAGVAPTVSTGAITVTYKTALSTVSSIYATYSTTRGDNGNAALSGPVPTTAIGGATGIYNSALDQVNFSKTLTGATAAPYVQLTFTARDSALASVSGIPTTVTTTGGSLIGSDGKAATSVIVYANEPVYAFSKTGGVQTITATNGTLTSKATINWVNAAADARVLKLTESAGTVTASVTDGLGAAVAGASVDVSITGGGKVGGASAGTYKTSTDGTVSLSVTGAGTVTASLDGTTYAKTLYLADYGDAVGVVSTPGAPAGVGSAKVDTAGIQSSSDAVDASNEATDAANAATDAANAAAEAADAATAAAQDAQAAVAALASQVADLIAGIKAQITALTNLVIKIQKKVKA